MSYLPYSLEYYVEALMDAKYEESEVKAKRIQLEEQVATFVSGPDNGQKTIKLENGTSVTVKRGWSYKADIATLEKLDLGSTTPVPIKVKTSRELDEKGYEWYRENDQATFSLLSQYVTVTPKKVAVEVKQK